MSVCASDLPRLLDELAVRSPTPAEALALFEAAEADPSALDALAAAAARVRDREMAGRGEVEAAFNSVVPCRLRPLCLYCPYWREGASEPMSCDDVVCAVRALHEETDIRQFHLSGGSQRGGGDCGVVALVEAVRAAEFDDMEIVVNCGASFSDPELARLAELGVKRVFSVFETTDPDLFRRMKPGDDLDEKLSFARRVAAAGMQVGSGVMAGLPPHGEAHRAYVKTLFDLAALPNLAAIYVSKFRPAPGIVLSDRPACVLSEARALVAVARLVLRGVHIRAAAGWGADERQVAHDAGAGSIEVVRSFSKTHPSYWDGNAASQGPRL